MTSPAVVRVRALVSGRVQGVWYRESCRREAERLGVGGWVRNRPDGRVEIEAEGPRPAVDALLTWAGHGPPRAVVDRVAVDDRPPVGESRFRVA
ncbi:MAG TPA: acylphosphatase [Acidimicrobiales bacterium]